MRQAFPTHEEKVFQKEHDWIPTSRQEAECPNLSQYEIHRAMNSAVTSQTILKRCSRNCLSVPSRVQAKGRTPQVPGHKVIFNSLIFKQVVRVDYQVRVFLIALAPFTGAFQSSLGELNQNVIIVCEPMNNLFYDPLFIYELLFRVYF